MASHISIVPLKKEHVAACADTFIKCFEQEAFFKNAFDLRSTNAKERMKKSIYSRLIMYLALKQPIFVALDQNNVVGFSMSSVNPAPLNIRVAPLESFKMVYNFLFVLRYLNFKKVCPLLKLGKKSKHIHEPYLFLEAIGVIPEYRGKGIAKSLINETISYCSSKTECKGTYLFTGDYLNRNIYSKYGFEVVEERENSIFKAFHMFNKV